MSSADVHTLAGAYALDALSTEDRATFERHLAVCPDCQDEIASLTETASRLAAATALTPPPRLRDDVLTQIRRTPQMPPQASPNRSAAPRWLWAAAAGIAAALALGAVAFGWTQARQAEAARQALARVVAVTSDPTARRDTATVSGGGSVTLVVAGQRAVLLARNLPALPDGRGYQLWLLTPGTTPVSAGIGAVATAASHPWQRYLSTLRAGQQVAITVEPAGGSQQPSTAPLVVLG